MNKPIDTESLRYPIGKLNVPEVVSQEQIGEWIEDVASFPSQIKELTQGLPVEKLEWKYRPGGWTIRQVVHHCADSHMNAFIRFKLSLTEDVPTIKTYLEGKWAELPDTTEVPISASVSLIEGLHSRWVTLLNSMSEEDLKKELYHPEHKRQIPLTFMLGLYAWHSNHHVAHIRQALDNEGQFN